MNFDVTNFLIDDSCVGGFAENLELWTNNNETEDTKIVNCIHEICKYDTNQMDSILDDPKHYLFQKDFN